MRPGKYDAHLVLDKSVVVDLRVLLAVVLSQFGLESLVLVDVKVEIIGGRFSVHFIVQATAALALQFFESIVFPETSCNLHTYTRNVLFTFLYIKCLLTWI